MLVFSLNILQLIVRKDSQKKLYLYLLSTLFLLIGCKAPEGKDMNLRVIKLQEKVSELEKIIAKRSSILDSNIDISEKLFIKSVTFRMDSKDDRLRIYWSDGRKTDLQCSKEQATWACG